MTRSLEYHRFVRHFLSASVAFLMLLVAAAVCVPSAHAQINGVPTSVTSPGFGGRAINGPPASVTSLGPNGYSSNSRVSFSPFLPNPRHNGTGHHHQHNRGEFTPPLYYAVPVPYAVDENAYNSNDGDDADDDSADQGGPTVFDRRGLGERSYVPPVKSVPKPHSEPRDETAAVEPAPNPAPVIPTFLVFKDGRQLQIGNYAIVGATLYDLTPGHPRKIALADLDLEATQKQNEDHGVIFQLPPPPQAN
jgi:hypothetical protein